MRKIKIIHQFKNQNGGREGGYATKGLSPYSFNSQILTAERTTARLTSVVSNVLARIQVGSVAYGLLRN